MKNGLILIGIVFAIAMAIVFGNKLSNEAVAVVVGAVCGISASIPMALGIAIAASRNWGRQEVENYPTRQPPVYIVQPQQMQYPQYPQYQQPPMMLGAPNQFQAPSRDFKIVGEE